MTKSKIEWTDEVWNPVTGCSKVSPGCKNCYAERLHRRGIMKAMPPYQPWNANNALVNVTLHSDRLERPLRWKKPRMVFVNSMSDLFHEQIPSHTIATIFATMARARQHTFQVLTKRPRRMERLLNQQAFNDTVSGMVASKLPPRRIEHWYHSPHKFPWPLPNVWLGVSVEGQLLADGRIPLLLQTPAAVRFVSAEPLLGPIQLGVGGEFFDYGVGDQASIDWVIIGGESGPGARPMEISWARQIIGDCRNAGVPLFVKQLGSKPRDRCDVSFWKRQGGSCNDNSCRNIKLKHSKGGDPEEWPEELRVREMPYGM